jgi:predicted transposase YbfD/YdcC
MDHATRAVLAQRQVNGAPGEVPGFVPLLAVLDLAQTVVTADALHTHRDAAEFLVTSKQTHYLFTVKANQPGLLGRCERLAWHNVPVLDCTRDRAHGRVELRTLKAVTSLSHAQASPARLADLIRGHWAIENGLHWMRDVTFAEDRSQLRTGTGPAGHGLPAQPCHRRAQPGWVGQSRRRPALPRPRPTPTPRHPRHHSRMKQTSRKNAGASPGGRKPSVARVEA